MSGPIFWLPVVKISRGKNYKKKPILLVYFCFLTHILFWLLVVKISRGKNSKKNLYCWSTFVFWPIFISQIQEYFHFLLEVRSWTPRCHCVTPIYPNWPQFTPFDPNWPKLTPIDHVWPLWTSLTKIDLNLPQLTSIDRNWLQLTPNCSQLTQLTLTW